jgi:ribonuclease-3
VSSDGPDHDRHFVVEVAVDGQVIGTGEGRSRREAETHAAQAALDWIEAQPPADPATSEVATP